MIDQNSNAQLIRLLHRKALKPRATKSILLKEISKHQ